MEKGLRKRFLQAITANTLTFAKEQYPKIAAKRVPARDKKAVALETAIYGKFGCYENQILALVSEITGKKLEPKAKESSAKLDLKQFGMIALVPEGENQNGHNYPMGEAMLKLPQSDRGIRPDGDYGNHLSDRRSEVRPATAAEIAKLSDKQLAAYAKMANVVFI